MLKLIKCEFLKLKRKKFIPLIILAAFLFPIPLTYLMTTPSMMERYTDQAEVFWISGSDEAVTLIETTGTYSDTITLPDGGNYIGIECENFTGSIKLTVK